MRTLFITTMLLTLSVGLVLADKATDERLANAAKAFEEIMSASDKGIPGSVLDKAACVVVVPGMKKGGFIIGGSFGRGAISCRGAGNKGWGAPAMVELGGGSVGFQIGAEATDVVMLVMNREGIDSLLKSKFTLGGEASVAGGPVGRSSTAETDAAMKAKILSYSRSRGAFAGVSLQGVTLHQDEDANKGVYGKPLQSDEILNGKVAAPAAAKPLTSILTKYSPKGV
jgi:lipid-binding SYLF domain-containing protein